MKTLLLLPIMSVAALISPAAADQIFQSGPDRTQVIELYTSEGCSSCPPADRYVRNLLAQKNLWDAFIPMAFHVDYWDYLGWHDPFANPDHSDRQRRYRELGGLASVYTPGFVVNGREWRSFFRSGPLPDAGGSAIGNLILEVGEAGVLTRLMPAASLEKDLEVSVAILGFDLISHVPAGENRGKSLRHDFVVLGVNTSELESDDQHLSARLQLPTPKTHAPRQGVVAWVHEKGRQEPLQAVGGWLDR